MSTSPERLPARGGRRLRRWLPLLSLPLLSLPLLLGGCAGAIEMLERKPSARVVAVRFASLSLTGMQLAIDVEVANALPVDLPIFELDWSLATDGLPFLRGSTELGGAVPASGRRTVTLPIELRFAELLSAISTARAGDTLPYAVDMGVALELPGGSRSRVPLRHTGTLPVPAPPTVRVVAVELEELTLQAARGVARIEVGNANTFPLELQTFSYGLTLGGVRIADGRTTRPRVFEPEMSVPFEIPLDLSPGALGRSIFETLSGERTSYALSGALEVGTPFGDMEMAFESGGETTVAR